MTTFRRIFRWIIVFAMFISIMAPVHAAQDYGMTWEISEDGVLTISGAGEMNAKPWASEAEKVTKVIIGEGITSICENAFMSCVNLEEIQIPDSVLSIAYEITNSSKLKQVFLPAGVVKLDGGAFWSCPNLEHIDVSEDNLYFTNDSFGVVYSKDMSMLLIAPPALQGSYSIPESVKSVGGIYQYSYPSHNILWDIEVEESYSGFFRCANLSDVHIPDSVEVIGTLAFGSCSGLTEVTIPDSVIELGNSSFKYCEGLKKIHIGSGVRKIGNNAFRLCTGLTEVIIPDSVDELAPYTFQNCDALERIHIGSGVRKIGTQCFGELDSLKEIFIPGNVHTIEREAFYNNKCLEKVFLEDGIANIETIAFVSCPKLKEVRLPATLRVISNSLFRNCVSLENITIPRVVQRIEGLAFDNIKTALTLTFEGNAPAIAKDAFEPGKVEFRYPEGNGSWEALVGTNAGTHSRIQWTAYEQEEIPEGSVYLLDYAYSERGDGTYYELELLSNGILTIGGNGPVPSYGDTFGQQVKKIVIQEGCLEFILNSRFDCPNLEELVVPDSMRSFSPNIFSQCIRLNKVTFLGRPPYFEALSLPRKDIQFWYPEGVEGWDTLVDTNLGTGARITWIAYERDEEPVPPDAPDLPDEPGTPGVVVARGQREYDYGYIEWVLYDDGLLETSGTLSPQESYWREYASMIRKVVIGEGCSLLGSNAFRFCSNLTEVVLPESLREIELHTFTECPRLERIYIPAGVVDLDPNAFEFCDNLNYIEVDPENTLYASDSRGVVFNKEMTMLLIAPKGLKGSYTVPETVTAIGGLIEYHHKPHFEVKHAYLGFKGCGQLTDIVLPQGLESIGNSAFLNCTGLKSVKLPDDLKEIGLSAFFHCSRLKEIHISGVRYLPGNAFAECGALERVVLGDGVEEIGDHAFQKCRVLREVVFPDSLKSIGTQAFESTDISSLTLPEKLLQVGEDAFQTSDLTHVTFLGNPPSMKSFERSNAILAYPEGNEKWKAIVENNAGWHTAVQWTPYRTEVQAGTDTPIHVINNGRLDNGITWILETNGTLTIRGTGEIAPPVPWAGMEDYILRIVVEEGITHIPDGAFRGFTRLRSVFLASTVKSLGTLAFENCTNLEKLEFVGFVPALGEGCFENVIGTICHNKLDDGWNSEILEKTGGSFILVPVEYPQPEPPEQPEGILGDVDGNGKLTYNDALLVLRASISLETLTLEQEILADFDGNGTINYSDALKILRASIGLT